MSKVQRVATDFLDQALSKRRADRGIVIEAFDEAENKLHDVLAEGTLSSDVENDLLRDREVVQMLRVMRGLRKSLNYISKQEQTIQFQQGGDRGKLDVI